ncbi:MAG: hypothetical protein IPO72_12395 [Saprospiraceae bacterium]|nr:hypothetical protein [Candidatus Vicinibacter affinis]
MEICFNFNINLDEPEVGQEFGKLTEKYELGIEQSGTGKIKIKRVFRDKINSITFLFS